MKKLLGLLLLPALAFGAVEYDLRKGIDITGLTNVTASQINQLVDNGIVWTNKGMVVRRGSVHPDVTLNPRYTNFLWLDISGNVFPGILKSYVPIGDANSNWVAVRSTATLAANSVTSSELATNSVQEYHIVGSAVTASKIGFHAVNNSHIDNGAVGNNSISNMSIITANLGLGIVQHTNIDNLNVVESKIGPMAVTRSKIADDAISAQQITNSTITGAKIATNTIESWNYKSNSIQGWALTNNALTVTNLSTNVAFGLVKAWAMFDVGVSPTVKGSFNISNVIRISAGNYNINFGTAFANTNYAVIISMNGNGNAAIARSCNSSNSQPHRVDAQVRETTAGGLDELNVGSLSVMVIGN